MFKFIYGKDWISKIFLGVLAFSFILGTAIMWGPGGLNFGGGNFVAKVGDITISPKEYMLELNRLQRLYGNRLTKEQLKREALNNLLIRGILAYLAEQDGFYVSREEIMEFIRIQFSDKNGTFHPEYLERYLQMLRLSPSEFEEMIRLNLLADKYKRAVYSTTYVNNATLEALLLPFTLSLKVEVLKLSYKRFENRFNPSEAELKKFYDRVKENFAVEEPPRVEIFKAKTAEEAENLIKILKRGKSLKPVEIVSVNATRYSTPDIRKLVEKALQSKGVAVVKSKEGEYLIGVYKPAEKKTPAFEEVKAQVKEIYKRFKAVEWMHQNINTLAGEILSGKYPVKEEKSEISAYALMEKFNLTPEDIFALLGGQTLFKVPTPDGIAVVKVLSVEEKNNLSPAVVNTYKLTVRNGLYIKKLQEVLSYVYQTQRVKIEINNALLERL